jgi:hypothetical protein
MKKPQSVSTPVVSMSAVESAELEDSPGLVEDLARLRELLEQGAVEEARAFVKEIEKEWPDSQRVRHFARVLAPPIASVRRGERGRSLEREHAWLREHAREYPGCWLAVWEDRLIAADPDLNVVIATARRMPGAEHALLHFQPGASACD